MQKLNKIFNKIIEETLAGTTSWKRNNTLELYTNDIEGSSYCFVVKDIQYRSVTSLSLALKSEADVGLYHADIALSQRRISFLDTVARCEIEDDIIENVYENLFKLDNILVELERDFSK